MSLAEDAIKSAVTRRLARSVVIKDAKAWEELHKQLQTAMSNAWNDAMREGIANALDRLRDLGPGQFSKEDGAAILRVLEGAVGSEAIRAAMREPVINLTDALFRLGGEEVGQATGVSIAFMRPDLDALDVLKNGNLYWVGNSWNAHTQKLLAKALDDYFREGMTREGLTQRFAEDFASVTGRGSVYWEMLADHTATKTREIGRVSGYERAGIKRVQVRAHMDENTTEICRAMHGRIIEVGKMRSQANAYLRAVARRNSASAKEAWDLNADPATIEALGDGELPSNVASPPYHFRCRTITVAYFGAPARAWQKAAMPSVPHRNREEVVRFAETSFADRAEFNTAISARNAASFTAAIAQTKSHFELGRLARYGSVGRYIKGGGEPVAFYADGYRWLGVNAKAFKRLTNPATPRPAMPGTKLDFSGVPYRWFATDPTPANIARHEYGHWFHDTFQKEVNDALNAAKTSDPGWPLMVSAYAQTDDAEWFAESFALYFAGPDEHHRIAPSVMKLLKEKDLMNDA